MSRKQVLRNHKDTVFRLIFREKKDLLELYNAVNGTGYDRVEDLEINTLENAVYMNMKNDISFVVDFQLNLYEHQSTVNPNIPLRNLFYVSKVLQNLVKDENLHGSRRIKIPVPKFVVFYNGSLKQPERVIHRLSDLFEKKQEEAVSKAVEDCIEEGILVDFFKKNRAEAIEVSIFEYNEEVHLKSVREEGVEEGREEGLRLGEEKLLEKQVKKKLERGKLLKEIAEDLEETEERIREIVMKLKSL